MAGEGPDVDGGNANNGGEEQRRHKTPQRRRYAQGKRTRTGCERCRVRHKKCDEQKPRCRGCVEGAWDCRYITRVSFLDKNSRTVTGDPVPVTGSGMSGYSAVQFVNDGTSAEESERTSAADEVQHRAQEQTRQSIGPEDSSMVPCPSDSMPSEQPHDVVHETVVDFSMSPEYGHFDTGSPAGELLMHAVAPQNSTVPSTMPIPTPSVKKLSLTDNTIYLMKYYTHHVAPWLDIFDLGHTFGLLIPPLAMVSPLILEAVLKVAAMSSGSCVNDIEQYKYKFSDLQIGYLWPGQVPDFTIIQQLLRSVLLKTQGFVDSVPDTWQHIFFSEGSTPYFPHYRFEDASYQRIWFSVIALMSRLEIAYSLMYETAPAIGSELIREMLASSEAVMAEGDGSQKTGNASLHCLAFLADVMHLCLQPADQDSNHTPVQTRPHGSRAERWKYLLNELKTWHNNRPSELQELAELEGKNTSFPTVIYTSRAGISTNILYHVTMFLLLRHRPRTIQLHEEHNRTEAMATHLSPLWHARRVCGIALNLNAQHSQCWDPCMIAAFTLTARGMTHPAQQVEILECLNRVKASGWRIDNLVRNLRDEWGLGEPR